MSHYTEYELHRNSIIESCPESYGKNIEFEEYYPGSKIIFVDKRSDPDVIRLISRESYNPHECSFSDKDINFNVTDLALVKDLSLTHLMFNAYVQIELNDHLIYSGPEAGSYLSIVSTSLLTRDIPESRVYNGKEFMPCDNNQIWKIDTRISLKPFLQTGDNNLHFRFFEGSENKIFSLEMHSTELCPALLIGEEAELINLDNTN
jgi:hypothetical protein